MGAISRISAILIVVFLIVGVAVGYFAGSLTAPVTTITKAETRIITLTVAPTPPPTTTPWPRVLSIATSSVGGIYYPPGGGFVTLISKYIPGVEATAEVN